MLLKSNAADEEKFRNPATFPIIIDRQDEVAHIVRNTEQNVKAYAIFDNTIDLADQWIYQENSPSLVMLKQLDASRIQLSLSDPDMRRASAINIGKLTDAAFYDPGSSFDYQIILNGVYTLDGANPGVSILNGPNTTTLNISVKEGKSYSVVLKPVIDKVDFSLENSSIKCIATGVKNVYRIESTADQKLNINLHSIDGKMIKYISNAQLPYTLQLEDVNCGVYIISMQGSTSSLNKKLIVF